MLSLASLLNPVKPEAQGMILPTSPSPSFHTSSSTRGSPQPLSDFMVKKQKMTKDGAIFSKGKIKGEINFPPFQNLDQGAMAKIEKYRIYPMGRIEQYCRHIPYNSEKKSFLEKTGRESFEGMPRLTYMKTILETLADSLHEVFQYTFKLPNEEKEYTVMWDYNIGLVRITPFFKCFKYSKVRAQWQSNYGDFTYVF